MPKRIFYLEGNTDGTVGGSYYVLYDLVTSLDFSKYEPVVAFHTDNLVADRLKSEGIETHIIPKNPPFSFSTNILNKILMPIKKITNFLTQFVMPAFTYATLLKKLNIDLVNLNNSMTRNHAWMLAANIAGIKCMTHEMGINNYYSKSSRYFGKKLDSIVCVSHAIKEGMLNCGINYPNISVIHNGLKLDRYYIERDADTLRKEHYIDVSSPIIGVVGNIKKWKGQETIIRATGILKDKYPDLRCLLVGDTSPGDQYYHDSLIEISKSLDITENVIFTGFQQNIIDYMALMDIVVHTSVEPEPFGIVLLEAMFAKKPLISTTIGGPAEIVENGKTGLLVEPGNPQELSNAIDNLLSDKAKSEQFGLAGFDRLNSEFSLEKNVRLNTDNYDKIFNLNNSIE